MLEIQRKVGIDGMVRLAEEKDLSTVNALRKQVNEIHAAGRPDFFKAGFGEELANVAYSLLNEENKDILVVERDGVVCGMACVEYVFKSETPYSLERNFYHVTELAVDKEHRRQGVARELLEFIKIDAKRRKLNTIELNVWAFNESAIEFYSVMGFQKARISMECKV